MRSADLPHQPRTASAIRAIIAAERTAEIVDLLEVRARAGGLARTSGPDFLRARSGHAVEPAAQVGSACPDFPASPGSLPGERRNAMRAARLAIAVIAMALLARPPVPLSPGPVPATTPPILPAPLAASSAMAPWPIGLTAVLRPTPPALTPPTLQLRARLVPDSLEPDRASTLNPPLHIASSAPQTSPFPAARWNETREMASSVLPTIVDFIRAISAKGRPSGADWETLRD